MKTTRLALVALTVSTLIGVSACGSDDDSQTGDDTASVSTSSGTTSSTQEDDASESSSKSAPSSGSAEDLEPLMAAIATAEKSEGGTAYEADDQDEDGTWEIDVAVKDKSVEVTVSADGSEVVTKDDEEKLDEDVRAGLEAAEVTIGEAIETALQEVDGTFDDAELEAENGTHVWEVDIDTADGDVDVLVDVTSGKVIDRRTD